MSFENDVTTLKEILNYTESRIKKLEEHKESEGKKPNPDYETLRRLEKNLDDLHKKRVLILSEFEG